MTKPANSDLRTLYVLVLYCKPLYYGYKMFKTIFFSNPVTQLIGLESEQLFIFIMVGSFKGYGWWGLGGQILPHFLRIFNSFSCIKLPQLFDFYFLVEK
jgi:hypothetical protein